MEPVTFTTEDGIRLEGELRLPDVDPAALAIICHAHPRHGGSKDHPVLWAIRNELASNRCAAVLGFNFRGTMGSGGSYGGGRDELKDARAAVSYMVQRLGDLPLISVGWSFGASVALREALDDDRVSGLVMVGTPLQPGDLNLPPLPDRADARRFSRPLLLLAGENDEFCPTDELREFALWFPRSDVVVFPGTDHYLWRREREAATAIGEAMSSWMAPG
jgi:hypothetical protein